jgi:hypothetical protein
MRPAPIKVTLEFAYRGERYKAFLNGGVLLKLCKFVDERWHRGSHEDFQVWFKCVNFLRPDERLALGLVPRVDRSGPKLPPAYCLGPAEKPVEIV